MGILLCPSSTSPSIVNKWPAHLRGMSCGASGMAVSYLYSMASSSSIFSCLMCARQARRDAPHCLSHHCTAYHYLPTYHPASRHCTPARGYCARLPRTFGAAAPYHMPLSPRCNARRLCVGPGGVNAPASPLARLTTHSCLQFSMDYPCLIWCLPTLPPHGQGRTCDVLTGRKDLYKVTFNIYVFMASSWADTAHTVLTRKDGHATTTFPASCAMSLAAFC